MAGGVVTSQPATAVEQISGSGHGARHRADLIERRGERDQPIPADQTVGRLHAHDPAQRGRLADRAAGIGSEGTEAPSRRLPTAADPPDEPPGTRSVSHGFRVGPKAEFSVDDPMANSSMFVLPEDHGPGSRSRATAVASYGGT